MLPAKIRKILEKEAPSVQDAVEEVRLAAGNPLFLYCRGEERLYSYRVAVEDVTHIVQVTSKYSLYAFEEELRHGYITVPGGHRVGLTGRAILEAGRVKRLCSLSSVNIRVARQVLDAARPLLPLLMGPGGGSLYSTMIISPPRKGKTTLLRDLARLLSSGSPGLMPLRVGVVDERSEICGSFQGVPQLDVGPRTDVLDACPKAEGMMMLIRSMGPQVLITDEIGRQEDVLALQEALKAGVTVITSAHGGSFRDLQGRPVLKEIITRGYFQRFVILAAGSRAGTLEAVLDGEGKPVKRGGVRKCSSLK